MKIMFAITKGEVGGAQEHVRILARGLLERGHQVAIMVSPGSHLAESVEAMGGSSLPWASITGSGAPLANLSARRELREAVDAWQPHVLHLHSSVAGAVGCRILCPPEGVTVFTCHHAPFGPGRRWSNRTLSRPVAQITLPRMDGIITVGTRDMPALKRIARRVPIALVRNAVPNSGPPVSDGPPRPSALWVARLADPKDPLTAVRAWEKVASRLPQSMLTICGSGPLEPALRDLVSRSGAKNNINVAGFVRDVTPMARQASIFFLVSKVEGGISMATLEAMSAGLVPVVTDAGDADLLTQLTCGVVARSNDPVAIADAVTGLLEDPDRFKTIRENALAFARDSRSVDDMVDETISFYDRIVDTAHIQVTR